jgi:hypothetical protein
MSEQGDGQGDKSVSRRTALKRIGAAGAIAWVAPAISSLNTPAHASSAPVQGCTNVFACDVQATCGSSCNCVPTTEQTGFCHQGIDCGGAQTCRASSDCPAGWACASTCCVGRLVCVPPCGNQQFYKQGVAVHGARMSVPS